VAASSTTKESDNSSYGTALVCRETERRTTATRAAIPEHMPLLWALYRLQVRSSLSSSGFLEERDGTYLAKICVPFLEAEASMLANGNIFQGNLNVT
jgi:hypothetical protein